LAILISSILPRFHGLAGYPQTEVVDRYQQMKCQSCHKTVSRNSNFCPHCSYSFKSEGSDQSTEALARQTQPPFATPPAISMPKPSTAVVDNLKMGMTQAPWMTSNPVDSSLKPSGDAKLLDPEQYNRQLYYCDCGTLTLDGGENPAAIHLFGKDKLTFGRVPEPDSVTLYVLPLDHANRILTQSISSNHFRIHLEDKGLRIEDVSTYGTSLNGIKVQGSTMIPLDKISEVTVANNLTLRLTPFTKQGLTEDQIQNAYNSLVKKDLIWEKASALGLGGLLIERASNMHDTECYLMLFTWVALGTFFESNGKQPALTGGKLRLVRHDRQFLLHNLDAEVAPIIGEFELPQASIYPLIQGVNLKIGSRSCSWNALKQYGIDPE
jgi:hypothetical protein